MSRTSEALQAIPALMCVISIAVAGMAISHSCSRHKELDGARRVATAVASRDSAIRYAAAVRDSAATADRWRSAAWDKFVADLQSQHQVDLQKTTRSAAARARSAVETRTGKPFAMAPDTGSGKPPCLVTLTCSEAAAWHASDSLTRADAESTRSWAPVTAAACSAKVAEARVTCESSCADRSRSTPRGPGFVDRLITLFVVGLLGFLSGLGAGL